MIGYLKGKIMHLAAEYCIVETVGGVGYRVFLTGPTLSRLEHGQEVRLYVHTSVREDAILLYGFWDYEEYELFLTLIGVNGIGAKVALGVLSFITPDAFRLAVLKQDTKALTALPGIGKKTAERLLLELRDKIGVLSTAENQYIASYDKEEIVYKPYDEAVQALVALGYGSGEIMPVLKKVAHEEMTAEAIIKAVLKEMAGRK